MLNKVMIHNFFWNFSFLIGGLLFYFHWEAMLISYLAQRVVKVPFNNMEEFYDSDYTLSTIPGSSYWDSFEFGNELWRNVHKNKLEPVVQSERMDYLLKDQENALYSNFFEFPYDIFCFCQQMKNN